MIAMSHYYNFNLGYIVCRVWKLITPSDSDTFEREAKLRGIFEQSEFKEKWFK